MAWSKHPEPPSEPEASPTGPTLPESGGRLATLGPSLRIKGSLSGNEDLLIEGQVEGEISLRKHNVTIGSSGKVKADIHGKCICVEGEVSGNLYGSEEVIVRRTGRVEGNAVSPRVTLENGAKFRGSIDMQRQGEEEAATADRGRPAKSPQPPSHSAKQKGPGRSEVAATPPAE